jgi:hypothetical protein
MDAFIRYFPFAADEKLHAFQLEGGTFKPSLEVDFIQREPSSPRVMVSHFIRASRINIRYHKIKNANVAFLAFKLQCHEGNGRSRLLVVRGTPRTPLIEFSVSYTVTFQRRCRLMTGTSLFGRPLFPEKSLYPS